MRESRRCIQKAIRNYFRYFPGRRGDEDWGFHLSAIGRTRIGAGTDYPPPDHPAGRRFSWTEGRVLPALQLVVIRRGGGVVEWRAVRRPVTAGMAFVLLPGEWHRYRPDEKTGWDEEWLELRGEEVSRWVERGIFDRRVYRLREPGRVWRAFAGLHRAAGEASDGAAGVWAGMAMSLLAAVTQVPRSRRVGWAGPVQRLVVMAREQLDAGVAVGEVARCLRVSYPALHRHFRAVMGMSPKQYATAARNARAEVLLADGGLSVKEVAARLGYHSAAHFSLAFKRQYGVAPSVWRRDLARLGARGDVVKGTHPAVT